jgi:hypothetical protein
MPQDHARRLIRRAFGGLSDVRGVSTKVMQRRLRRTQVSKTGTVGQAAENPRQQVACLLVAPSAILASARRER